MLREQGWAVDHTSVFRWVQRYGPELAKRCRAFLKPTNRSCRTDETFHEMPSMRCLVLVKQFFPVRGRSSFASAILFRHWLLPILCFVCRADREAFRRRRSSSVPASIRTGFSPLHVRRVVLVGVRFLRVGAAIYVAASRAWSHPAVTGTRCLPTLLSASVPCLGLLVPFSTSSC